MPARTEIAPMEATDRPVESYRMLVLVLGANLEEIKVLHMLDLFALPIAHVMSG